MKLRMQVFSQLDLGDVVRVSLLTDSNSSTLVMVVPKSEIRRFPIGSVHDVEVSGPVEQ